MTERARMAAVAALVAGLIGIAWWPLLGPGAGLFVIAP